MLFEGARNNKKSILLFAFYDSVAQILVARGAVQGKVIPFFLVFFFFFFLDRKSA